MTDKPMAADLHRDWSEPGAVPVAPGVHRIPLPMPNDGLHAVNVYAIEDGDGLTMIDGGWAVADARDALEKAIDQIGYGLRDINRFLVTHAHRDHYTLAVVLRREFGTPIGLGAGERESITQIIERDSGLGTQIQQLIEAGAPDLAELMSHVAKNSDAVELGYEQPDEWLDAGIVHVADRKLRVVPTPGHTRGHIVFADEAAGVLFAGDHVLPHITPSIGFEPVPSNRPLSDYLESLALMRTLPDLRLLPAHGNVTDSTYARVDALIAHHDNRLMETMEAVSGLGAGTGLQVAEALGWTRRRRAFSSLDSFNQMLATTETVAHLKLLVLTGKLIASGDDVVTYTPAVSSGASSEDGTLSETPIRS